MERLLKRQFLAFYFVAFLVGFFVGMMTVTAHSDPTPPPSPSASIAPVGPQKCRGVYVQPIHPLHWWQKMEVYYAFYMQGRAFCLVGDCGDCTPIEFAEPVKP